MKCGELFNQMPKNSGGDHGNQYTGGKIPDARKFATDDSTDEKPPLKPKLEVAAEMGFNKNQVSQFRTLVIFA